MTMESGILGPGQFNRMIRHTAGTTGWTVGETCWVKHRDEWTKVYLRKIKDDEGYYGIVNDEKYLGLGKRSLKAFRKRKPSGGDGREGKRINGLLKEIETGYDRYAPKKKRRKSR